MSLADHDARSLAFDPLVRWLETPGVDAIAVNRPFEVWLRSDFADGTHAWGRRRDMSLTRGLLAMVAKDPITHGIMPGGYHYAAVRGAFVRSFAEPPGSDAAVAITAARGALVAPRLRPVCRRCLGVGDVLASVDQDDPIARLIASFKSGDHLVVSGATGAGKTTLLELVLRHFDQSLRVITIEEMPRIVVDQRNHFGLKPGWFEWGSLFNPLRWLAMFVVLRLILSFSMSSPGRIPGRLPLWQGAAWVCWSPFMLQRQRRLLAYFPVFWGLCRLARILWLFESFTSMSIRLTAADRSM
jgi:hypothetical protein